MYIYGQSKLIIKSATTERTTNGFFEIKDVDCTFENSIFYNENASYSLTENNLENSFIKLQKNRFANQFFVKNSTFIGHSTSKNGSVLSIAFFQGSFLLNNCTFQHNQAFDYGGAVYLYYSSSINITSCNFLSNQASQGGSIYYDDSALKINEDVVLNLNFFTRNKATSSGGALMFNDKVLSNVIINNNFSMNEAKQYGNDTASEPKRVLLTSLNKEQYNDSDLNFLQDSPFITFEIPSGVKLNITLSFVITDYFYQKVNKNLIEYSCIYCFLYK